MLTGDGSKEVGEWSTLCGGLSDNTLGDINAKGGSSINSEGIEHTRSHASENVRSGGWEVVRCDKIAIHLKEIGRGAIAWSPPKKD